MLWNKSKNNKSVEVGEQIDADKIIKAHNELGEIYIMR
jgi:hypothetical protein